jgi:hypothetical protein
MPRMPSRKKIGIQLRCAKKTQQLVNEKRTKGNGNIVAGFQPADTNPVAKRPPEGGGVRYSLYYDTVRTTWAQFLLACAFL